MRAPVQEMLRSQLVGGLVGRSKLLVCLFGITSFVGLELFGCIDEAF